MHDIRVIRDNPSAFDASMARRGLSPVSPELLKLDEARRAKILAAETAQAEHDFFKTIRVGIEHIVIIDKVERVFGKHNDLGY